MRRGAGACLVCGKPLVYFEKAQKMECMICHREFDSNASCEDGHFVCDDCHAKKGIEVIMGGCLKSTSKNPVEIMQTLMENPYIYMHGPEHHVMVGAALLTAYYNCGGFAPASEPSNDDSAMSADGKKDTARESFVAALEEMRARGCECPGGACGFWGCCGAAVSSGMFMSIVTKATPLTGKSWRYSNMMTAKVLEEIARLGGPRCCKRNSFTAAKVAVKYVKEILDVKMELPEKIICDYSPENQQCLRKACPYYRESGQSML